MEPWTPIDASSPEKKLTVVALRLAILEKAASGVGALGFIWATVVLLGGFAVALERADFWFVTVILLVEGARIFSRSHELKWQHQATWSLAEASAMSFRAIRSSSRSVGLALRLMFSPSIRRGRGSVVEPDAELPVSVNGSQRRSPELQDCFPTKDISISLNQTLQSSESPHHLYKNFIFNSSSISRLLYWLQLISATACVVLSLTRLAQQDYGEISSSDESSKRNRRPALNIFYALALSEALLFLTERAYWEWKVSRRLLLEEVNRECGLGPTGLISVRRFFYDAYSSCINSSIFEGIKMDMVSFGEELLVSGSRDEQLIGARILLRFADKAVKTIGTKATVIERLVEMLNWKSAGEEEIRMVAAVVVSKLAGKKRNGIRVAGMAGAMESISSLLYAGGGGNGVRLDEVSHQQTTANQPGNNNHHYTFNLLGLLILKKLAKDPDNCVKISKTKGLIPKIIDFTTPISQKLRHQNPLATTAHEIQAAKRSLQVLKMLAGTTGRTGETLRREISEIVFTIGNIREILKQDNDENLSPLQKLGVEVIACLAMDDAARESIGATGGMMRELLRIFLVRGGPAGGNAGSTDQVRVEAGNALAMLVVENERNCRRVLGIGENVVEQLVEAIGDFIVRVPACRILTYLCGNEEVRTDFQGRKEIIKAFPMVMNDIMFGKMKWQEASIGFFVQIVRFMSPITLAEELERANISEIEFAKRLVHMLQTYSYPSIETPSIRRHVIELSIWLMQSNEKYIKMFATHEMAKELQNVSETTSDVECFIVFCGYVGLTRHRTTMASLIETALELVGKDKAS